MPKSAVDIDFRPGKPQPLHAAPSINLTELFDRPESAPPADPSSSPPFAGSRGETANGVNVEPAPAPDPVRMLHLLKYKLPFEEIDAQTRPKPDPTPDPTDDVPIIRMPRFEGVDPRPFPRLSVFDESSGDSGAVKNFRPPASPAPCPVDDVQPSRPMRRIRPMMRTETSEVDPESQPAARPEPGPTTSDASSTLRPPDRPILLSEGLTKSYTKGKIKIPVLKGTDFAVCPGEFVSIIGQSGSGKSTLLHLLGTLDKPDAGAILFDGERIDNISIKRRDALRNRSIGFIFQFYHLLPELTTLENVLSPLMIRESVLGYLVRRREYIEKGKQMLDEVGLSHRLKHKPGELSGGEMQRAAIARALVASPKILLADEPTGNLDSASAREIITLLRRLNNEHKLTIVMVTHDTQIAETADRQVRMVDGVIV